MPAHSDLAKRSARSLTALRDYRGLSDNELSATTGLSRSQIEQRRRGAATLTLNDLEAIASALQVEPFVLLLPPNDALRWALDNAPNSDGSHPHPRSRSRAEQRRPRDGGTTIGTGDGTYRSHHRYHHSRQRMMRLALVNRPARQSCSV